MKHLLLGLTICLQAAQCFGQITLEKKYAPKQAVRLAFLEGEGVKYSTYKPIISTNKKSLSFEIALYNLNHSVYKTFNSPVINVGSKSSFSSTGGSIYNISTKIFNTTSEIEYCIQYWVSDSVGQFSFCEGCSPSPIIMQNQFFKIFNENGTTVMSFDTASIGYIGGDSRFSDYNCSGLSNVDGKLKLSIHTNKISDGAILIKNSTSWYKEGGSTIIYSLPGTFAAPTALNDEKLLNQDKASLSAPMPNPSSETTRIEFQLPAETSFGEITVYNGMGLRVKSYKVDNAFGDLLLNNSDLASGNYTYQLIAGGKRIGSQKMMVIK